MAHTNETVNYHLSQFVGTDIPNPLVDYNGDMEKIDTAIKNVADAEAGYASDIADLEIQNGSETLTTTAQTLSGAVNELDSEVGDINTRLTSAEGKITADEGTLATAVSNISTLSGKVSAVETKVGSAVLVTTASDCSGAINELAGDASTLAGKVTALETQNGSEVLVTTAQTLSGAINEIATAGGAGADDITYDNTTSGLTATNVQSAIDEVADNTDIVDQSVGATYTFSFSTVATQLSANQGFYAPVTLPFTAKNTNYTVSYDISVIGGVTNSAVTGQTSALTKNKNSVLLGLFDQNKATDVGYTAYCNGTLTITFAAD